MNELAIDASITLSWLLPDEGDQESMSVRKELLTRESVWVPAHWRLEVSNSLWMAERRKRLNASGVAQAVALFMRIPVTIDPETNARAGADTLALARKHEISVYDAAYLELAMRRGAALGALDSQLRRVARKVGVAVLPDAIGKSV